MQSESHRLLVLPPLPSSSDFLPLSSLPVFNHTFNFTGRPDEEFLVFAEPDSLRCDFRRSGRRSLITLLWWSLCVVHGLACVCWKWFCFSSRVCSSANKSYLCTGKWYWKCQQCKGNACVVDLPHSVSYFLLLRYDPWHVLSSLGPWFLVGCTRNQKVAEYVALRLQCLTFYLPAFRNNILLQSILHLLRVFVLSRLLSVAVQLRLICSALYERGAVYSTH